MQSLNQRIGTGVLWNLASMFLTRGASTIFLLFLARMLAPDAFGLIAMASVVFELANVFVNSGLGAALIRSKNVSDADLNTVFFTNLGLSVAVYVAIFASAPYIAQFYSQPELAAVVQVMGLVVFINAAKIVQVAVLSRKMDFKTQMKANTIATVVSGVLAVTAAYQDWGVWSLVVQMLSQAAMSAIILWLAGNWRPSWQFSKKSFSRLFAFGRNLLAEGLLQVAFKNSYMLVIGRFFSAEVTGLYFFATKISNLISQQLTGAVQQATFPALATLQEDSETLKYKYRQIMQLMMFLTAPIMMLLAALAPTLIGLAFDKKWQGAVPYLQLLCIVGMMYPLHSLNVNLLNVKGRSDLVFKVGLLKKAINITLLILAIPYGVLGIVFSQVVSAFVGLVPNTYYSSKLVGYRFINQLSDVSKPILSAIIGGVIAFGVLESANSHRVSALLFALMIGATAYITICLILREPGSLFLFCKIKDWSSKKAMK